MNNLIFNSVQEAFVGIINELLNDGVEISPRGIKTKEITPMIITILNPRDRVVTSPIRKINYGFMVAELIWILNGSNDVDEIAHYNKHWRNFSDDGVILNGAYGQRIFKWNGSFDGRQNNQGKELQVEPVIIDQFQKAYEQLLEDKYSRQATIVLFNPFQDYRITKDKPCTNLMRFMIRDDKLNMMVVMRSNDCQKGLPYDIFNFTMLQEIMAGMLGIEVGKYTHVVDSMHVYESDFELSEQIILENALPTGNAMDARLSRADFELEFKHIYDLEKATRINSDSINLIQVTNMIEEIKNEYWRSLSAVLAFYNFRKAKRNQEDLDTLRKYITNEFANLEGVKNWKALI